MFEAQARMEQAACGGHVLVGRIAVRDARFHVEDVLQQQQLRKRFVQAAAQAAVAQVLADVDGAFRGVRVGRAGAEGVRVGVAQNLAVFLGQDVGVALQHAGDARREVFQGGRLDLERHGRFQHIGGVDVQQRGGVGLGCHAYVDLCIHGSDSTPISLVCEGSAPWFCGAVATF